MTLRSILTTTALSAAFIIVPASFADGHGGKHDMKSDMKAAAAMTDSAAKAPLQQKKAEDLYQRAEEQMDVGMKDKTEAMSGETLVLESTGETRDPLLGESETAMTAKPNQMTTPVNCPAGTTAQPDNTCMITGDYKKM